MTTGNRLDLLGKLDQRSINECAVTIGHGDRLPGPLVVDLDPTTFCDLACPECISASLLNQKRFGRDRLINMVDEFARSGVRAVVLIGGGEPLAHPATKDIIPLFAERDIHLGLVTNGTLIGGCLDVLAEYMAWVRVSVDAGTAQTFAQIRPSKKGDVKFDTVIENVRALAGKAKGSVGYSFLVVTRPDGDGGLIFSNHQEIAQAARLAKDIGCDYFEVKALFDDHHYVVPIPPLAIAEILFQMAEIKLLEGDGFTVEVSSTLEALTTGLQPQVKHYDTCPVAELRTVVTPSGVYTCAYHRGNPKALLGDVTEQPFDALWGGLSIRPTVPSRDCGFHCARHTQNLHIQSLADPAVRSDLVEDYDRFI